jgi:hypothetical protein
MTLYNVVGQYWNGSGFAATNKISVDIPGGVAAAVNYTNAVVIAPSTNAYRAVINNVEACPGVRWLLNSVSISVVKNDIPCDCINGNCVPATQYQTAGIYGNLANCQAGCAKNSTCTGECVDTTEIANLKQAISTLQAKICK